MQDNVAMPGPISPGPAHNLALQDALDPISSDVEILA